MDTILKHHCTTNQSFSHIILIGLYLKKYINIFSIVFALGYLMTFLGIWIYQTGFQSYTYISVGEPNLLIKYFEWIIGLIALGYLAKSGKKELDYHRAVSYDPFV